MRNVAVAIPALRCLSVNMVSCGMFVPPERPPDEERRVSGTASGAGRGRQAGVRWVLAIALLASTLSFTALLPRADAQDLSFEDAAWVAQRVFEAGVYIGGSVVTPNLHPEELPEFEDLYREC